MKRLLILLCMLALHATAPAVPADVMEARLRDTRFSSFSLSQVPLTDAVGLLKKRTDEITAETVPPAAEPINFILVPATAPPAGTGNHPPLTVSYDGRDVTLETILREIAKTANQEIFLTSVGVVITPLGMPPFPNPKAKEGEIFRKLTGTAKD